MLAHFFEEEGLPTTQISLIRLHTEKTKPPRALWVPFELGRPLGVPNDAAFQRRVLLAALTLLEAPSGPVLEEFPEETPDSGEEIIALACPVNFAQDKIDLGENEQLCSALQREMLSLRPWYQIAVEKHGRTTVGASGIALDGLGGFICSFLGGVEPKNPLAEVSLGYTLNLAAEDLKAYYYEGITAQPGQESAPSKVLSDWFWEETVAGDLLLAVKETCGNSENRLLQTVGRALIVPSSRTRRVRE